MFSLCIFNVISSLCSDVAAVWKCCLIYTQESEIIIFAFVKGKMWCCLQIISLSFVLYPKTILYQRHHYPLVRKTRLKEIGSLSKN